MVQFSTSQIDRLGERLRGDEITGEDLRFLDEYRRSFSEGYEHVVKVIRDELKLEPTGRPAKSTTSIRDKLRRESVRLSQIQDIAGCRIITPDIVEQENAIGALSEKLGKMKVFDRRIKPSHGYRAVHLIANCADRFIEIQVRSTLQHVWAEVSEKAADLIDPAVKYGGGPEIWRTLLHRSSDVIAVREKLQLRLLNLKSEALSSPDMVQDLSVFDKEMADAMLHVREVLAQMNSEMSK